MCSCRWLVMRLLVPCVFVACGATAAQAQVDKLVEFLKAGKVPAATMPTVIDRICADGKPADLRLIYEKALDPKSFTPELRLKAFTSLADAAQNRKVKPTGDLGGIAKVLGEPGSADLKKAVIRLAALWKVDAAGGALKQTALDAKAPLGDRIAALDGLTAVGGKAGREAIEHLATGGEAALRFRAIAALAALDLKAAAVQAASAISTAQADDDFAPLLDPFLTHKGGAEVLAAALQKQKLPKETAKVVLRTLFAAGNSDPGLNDLLSKAAEIPADPPPPTPQEVADYVAEVAAQGDPVRGEAIFRRADLNCSRCHSLMGAGGQVGPDLTVYLKDSPVEYVVKSILEPSASIKEEFLTKVIETDNGLRYTGIVTFRDDQQIKLKDAQGKEIVIAKNTIDDEKPGKSLMPDGITKFLTRAELLDLVRFVSELGKPGPFGPRETRTMQRWRILRGAPAEILVEAPNVEEVRKFLQDVPPENAVPVYSRVCGVLPVADLSDKKAPAAWHYVQGEVKVTNAGDALFRVKAPAGTLAWLDGSPVDALAEFTAPLTEGTHALVLRVADSSQPDDGITVEMLPAPGAETRLEPVGGQ